MIGPMFPFEVVRPVQVSVRTVPLLRLDESWWPVHITDAF